LRRLLLLRKTGAGAEGRPKLGSRHRGVLGVSAEEIGILVHGGGVVVVLTDLTEMGRDVGKGAGVGLVPIKPEPRG
jgi:hypothetical protein